MAGSGCLRLELQGRWAENIGLAPDLLGERLKDWADVTLRLAWRGSGISALGASRVMRLGSAAVEVWTMTGVAGLEAGLETDWCRSAVGASGVGTPDLSLYLLFQCRKRHS